MSLWFKKWLLIIGGLFLLFLAPVSYFNFSEDLVMAWFLLLLFCLMILGVVVIITATISFIKNILHFKIDWSLSDRLRGMVYRYFPEVYEAWIMSDFYRKHLTIKYGDGKIRVEMIQHYDLINAKYRRIFKYKAKHSYKEFINFSLRQAINGCNHIIFLINETDNRFVQFWTRKNILYMDFPMLPTNGMQIYQDQILDLLKSYGLKKTKDSFTHKTKSTNTWYYSMESECGGIAIHANFLTNIDLATEITIKILNGILGIKPEEVDLLMG